jgi:hypothetical protein
MYSTKYFMTLTCTRSEQEGKIDLKGIFVVTVSPTLDTGIQHSLEGI